MATRKPVTNNNGTLSELPNGDGLSADYLALRTDADVEVGVGELAWNAEQGTADLGLNSGGVVLQVGQESLFRVTNQSGSTIDKGTLVMAVGTVGSSGRILIAPWNGSQPSQTIMGLTTETIIDDGDGFVTHFGKLRGIDTTGAPYSESWSNGDILFAGASGGLTKTQPQAPNTKTIVALVINAHASVGELFIRPTFGSSLANDELVELTTLSNGQVIRYNSTNGRFENVTLTASDVGAYPDTNPSVNPTLDLDFANNDYTIYDSFANSYTDKPYADMLTVTNGVATGFDAIGVLRNSVANNIRLVFDPKTGVSQGALVEPAATNLLLRSNDFTTSPWTSGGTQTITQDALSPDNTVNAWTFEDTDVTLQSNRRQVVTIANDTTTYCASVFCKEGSTGNLYFRQALTGGTAVSKVNIFDFATKTWNLSGGGYEELPNGWLRVWQTITNNASGNTSYDFRIGATNNTASSIGTVIFYGAQLETGSVPTSYIKTEASTVTRVADQFARTLSNEFNPFEGTLFAEGVFSKNREQVFLFLSDGTLDNRVQVGLLSTGRPVGFINTAGVTEFNQDLDLGDLRNTTVKVALSYKNNSAFIVANGVASAIDASVALPTVTNMRVGSIDATTSVYNGTISTAQYYPKALSEAECIALTTLGA
jgi:hypothetical protein